MVRWRSHRRVEAPAVARLCPTGAIPEAQVIFTGFLGQVYRDPSDYRGWQTGDQGLYLVP